MGRVASTALSEAVLVLTLLAAPLALIEPSETVAEASDLLLAALVLFTALGIGPGRLAAVRDRWRRALALSFAPFLVLVRRRGRSAGCSTVRHARECFRSGWPRQRPRRPASWRSRPGTPPSRSPS
jgi:hypothetical protein